MKKAKFKKLEQTFKSRTFWLAVFSFCLGGLKAIDPSMLPDGLFILIQSLLLAGIGYFKVNPSQKYGK